MLSSAIDPYEVAIETYGYFSSYKALPLIIIPLAWK